MRYALALLCALLLAVAAAEEGGLRAKAREIVEAHKDAIVTVKVVTTTRYVYLGRESHKQENKAEVSGTMIDGSGLTVLSNFATDPYSGFDGFSFESSGDKVEFKPETTINELKIVLVDGTELPAQFVLKDKDLDLAFVRPREKPAQALPFLKLTPPAAEPAVLDETVAIGRLGREVNRASCVDTGKIMALVKKPRIFYVTDANYPGCPVFNIKGETLGISVYRQNPVRTQNSFGGSTQVILPAEDVLEAAKQAATAKPIEAKPAPKAEEARKTEAVPEAAK